jgi:hypothetical protein
MALSVVGEDRDDLQEPYLLVMHGTSHLQF